MAKCRFDIKKNHKTTLKRLNQKEKTWGKSKKIDEKKNKKKKKTKKTTN